MISTEEELRDMICRLDPDHTAPTRSSENEVDHPDVISTGSVENELKR